MNLEWITVTGSGMRPDVLRPMKRGKGEAARSSRRSTRPE
jgi:hypothetical protein